MKDLLAMGQSDDDDNDEKRSDGFGDLVNETLIDNALSALSEEASNLSNRIAKDEVLENYFEGTGVAYDGVFTDNNTSNDVKISYLLGLFELTCLYALDLELNEQRIKQKLPETKKLHFIFLQASAFTSELLGSIRHIGSASPISDYFKQRRYKMAICDCSGVEFLKKRTKDEATLMSAFPFNEEILIQARDLARAEGFPNFADLLDQRLKCENVRMHPKYIASINAPTRNNIDANKQDTLCY